MSSILNGGVLKTIQMKWSKQNNYSIRSLSSSSQQDSQQVNINDALDEDNLFYEQIKTLHNNQDMNGIIQLHESIGMKDMKITDPIVVNMILTAYLTEQKYEKVDDILNQNNPYQYTLDDKCYTNIIKHYLTNDNYDKARNVYKLMKQSNIPITNVQAGCIIIDMLMRLKDYTEVNAILRVLSERKLLDAITYCTLMKGYMKVGQYDKTREVYEAMKQSGVSIDSIKAGAIILDVLMYLQDYDEVTVVLKNLTENKLVNVVSYSTLMKGYMKVGEYDKAREVYELMKQSGISIDNIKAGTIILDLFMYLQDYDEVAAVVVKLTDERLLDIVSYSTLINGYIKVGQYDKVREVYKLMKQSRISIDTTKMGNIILDSLMYLQDYDEVNAIVKELSQKKLLDTVSYSSLIKGYMKAGQHEKAKEICESIRRSSILIDDTQAGSIILDLLMHLQDYDEVVAVVEKLTDERLLDIVSYSTMIKGYMKVGQYDKAREVYELMKQSGVSIDTTKVGNIILDVLLQLQDYDEVAAVVVKLTDVRLLDIVSYSTLIKGYMKVGDYDKAREVYEAMKQSGVSIDNIKAGTIILDVLMYLQDYDEVTVVLKNLTEKKLVNVVSYCTLMKGYMKVGQYDKAREVYEAMKQSGVSIDSIKAGTIILDVLMYLQDYDEVTVVLKKLTEKKLVNVVSYCTLMKGYMKLGQYDKAREVYEAMKQSGVSIDNIKAGNIILDVLMYLQDYDEVTVVLKNLTEKKLVNVVSYCTLMKGYMKEGQYDKAREVYEAMKQTNIVIDSVQSTCIIIDLLVKCKDFTEAELVLQTVIDNKVANCSSYTTLMKSYMRDSKYPSAQHVYDKMKQAKMCIDTNISGTIILDLLLKTHNTQEAISVFKDMLEKKLVDKYTVSTMKAGLKRCENTDGINDMNTILASYKLQEKGKDKKNENGDKTKRWKKVT